MSIYKSDTIAAISTPRGTGGIAVIRISGGDARAVAGRIFSPATIPAITEAKNARAYYGAIHKPGETDALDCGIATVYLAPRSYTGEDTVEISCHGGVLVTNCVLAAALDAGARLAEAGEFTRRALISGKLTLTEAEATGELLYAKTQAQLAVSGGCAASRTREAADGIAADLLALIARVNVIIDYPGEDLADISRDELRGECIKIKSAVEALQRTYRTGRAVTAGIEAVICGLPNAGKSTLFNRFTGEQSAIVTDIAGTTRDIITADVAAGRVLLHLSDTAGIRDAEDKIERIGVDRARDKIGSAELLIIVLDAEVPPVREDLTLLSAAAPVKLAVINKTDAGGDNSDIENNIAAYITACRDTGTRYVLTSLTDADGGFGDIVDFIDHAFTDADITLGKDAVITNERQHSEISAAAVALAGAVDAETAGLPVDLTVCELESALSALSRLSGREVGTEVVDAIFSKFCVGK